MIISIIVAMSQNLVIGKNNSIPWHLPADLKRFKEITMGHPIIMGRKTFESIGKILSGRKNIIVTRQNNYRTKGCVVVNSIEEAISHAELDKPSEVFFIGGAEIYKQALPLAEKLYLTIVHKKFDGDTFFPMPAFNHWEEISKENFFADKENPFSYSFSILKKHP